MALNATSKALGVISNNIANVSTEGYKAGDIRYSDLVNPASSGKKQVLAGVMADSKRNLVNDGVLVTAGSTMDIALRGRAMFVTSADQEVTNSSIELTDNGRLQLKQDPNGADADGNMKYYLANMKGNYMLGWPYDLATETFIIGAGIDSLEPIIAQSDDLFYEAIPTDSLKISANLDAAATAATQPAAASSYTMTFKLYDGTGPTDSLTGAQDDIQSLSSTFTKLDGINLWGLDFALTGGTIEQPSLQVKFDSYGKIESINKNTSTDPAIETWENAVDDGFVLPVDITWDGADAAQTVNIDWAKLTQLGTIGNIVNDYSVNGNLQGNLTGYKFDDNGVFSGEFDNGLRRPISKLAVGDTVAMDSMTPLKGAHYRTNEASGDLVLYEIDKTDRASLVPDYYETSTVDINAEFTNMIVVQRAYSSAATALRTMDEMLQTANQIR